MQKLEVCTPYTGRKLLKEWRDCVVNTPTVRESMQQSFGNKKMELSTFNFLLKFDGTCCNRLPSQMLLPIQWTSSFSDHSHSSDSTSSSEAKTVRNSFHTKKSPAFCFRFSQFLQNYISSTWIEMTSPVSVYLIPTKPLYKTLNLVISGAEI